MTLATDLSPADEGKAIRDGVADAFAVVLDATGGYPWTREDIIAAVREGVREAAADHLEHHPLNKGTQVEP